MLKYVSQTYIELNNMNRGELTGEIFGTSKVALGMPVRSQFISKRQERKNLSVLDDTIDINMTRGSQTLDTPASFHYFDPAMQSHSISEFDTGTQSLTQQRDIDQMPPPQASWAVRSPTLTSTPASTDSMQFNELQEGQLQNIHSINADYINNMAFDIYNEFCKSTNHDFCVFPIGIMRNLIERDLSINKIMSIVNNTEMFHQTRVSGNKIISRATAQLSLDAQTIKNKLSYYEDNDNMVVEFPMNNPSFAFGIICDRDKGLINLSSRLFSSYMMNLRKQNINVFVPAFKMPNTLNATGILRNLGHVRSDRIHYLQTLYFEFQNAVYIKNSMGRPVINLSEHIIYYIRYVPNNVLLFIGRHF